MSSSLRHLRDFCGLALVGFIVLFAARLLGADIPPKPAHYFNDYAALVSPQTAQKLDRQLEDFERETSNQILVVIYKSLPQDAALEDFAEDTFRAWKPGQQGKNNGAILFLFVNDRRARIQTGYGLEGALPDAICKRIISDELAPRFKTGDFDGGLTAAVNAMIAATRGEYKGSGRTVAEMHGQAAKSKDQLANFGIFIFIVAFILLIFLRNLRRGTVISHSERPGGTWYFGGGGGGGFFGGGGGGGGGGGFTGGGGDSGGGGASGNW
ncbi:MAG TPA: TPM domain-containing protein [Chthoniobacterales bacterium]|jgi:uncharacterized protein|nr:TPM domain-containing protein [Chthoniobacterales bacterium]